MITRQDARRVFGFNKKGKQHHSMYRLTQGGRCRVNIFLSVAVAHPHQLSSGTHYDNIPSQAC